MGILIFMSIGLILLLTIPIVTALFARRMGRQPWLWFFVGCFLPVIAVVILFFLPDNSLNQIKNKNKKI